MKYKCLDVESKITNIRGAGTNRKAKEEIWRLYQRLKDVAKVLSIEYEIIDERPTTIEHHGGNNDST